MLGLGLSISSEDSSTNGITLLVSAFGARLADDGGTIENPSCMQQDLADLVAEAAPFTTGLLEFYPGAAAAYSLRQLRRSVSPYAIRVRRANDLEQDIGFNSNGELDTNALLAFADGGDAWVSVWYDQSSNGNDAVQSTKSSQPKIVDRTTGLVTENGKPALQFDGSDDFMTSGDYIVELSQNPVSLFCVSQSDALTVGQYILAEGDSVSPYSSNFILGSATASEILWVNGTTMGTMQAGQVLIGFDWDETNATAFIDGSQSDVSKVVTVNTETSLYSYIGRNATTGAGTFFIGKIQELITYKSDQSSNRTGIETNINDFYSIYS